MSDIKKDKELFDIPPGMRGTTTKTPGKRKLIKFDIRSKVALLFFTILLILAFVFLFFLFRFAWQHITHDSDIFSFKKIHKYKPTPKKEYKKYDRHETEIAKDPNNIQTLIRDVREGDEKTRRRAMRALGEKGDPAGIPAVVGILRTKDAYERMDAISTLGEFKHHLAVEPLIETLDSRDESVRRSAISTLSRTHDLRALNALIEVLSSKDYPSRASAANGLGNFKHPLAAEALIEALSDEDEEVRRNAVVALGKIGDPRIVERLNRIRDETTDKRLKNDIMVVLNQIDDADTPTSMYWKPSDFGPEDTGTLIATLKSTEKKLFENTSNYNRTVFFETVEALGKTGDVRAEKALLELLEKDYRPQTVKKIIEAVKNIGSPYSIPPLIKKLDDPNEMVSDSAYLYLFTITGYFSTGRVDWNEWWEQNEKDITKYNSKDMVASFITALKDPNLTVKKFAINFLGRTRDTRIVEPLIEQFYSEGCDKRTRRDVAKALARIKNPRTIETLIVALDMDYGYSNFIAVKALGEFGDPAAVEPLIKILESSTKSEFIEDTLSALERIGDPRATEAILEKLDSPDPEIRKYAARALEGAGDMSAIPRLKKALDDEDKYVRDHAAKAILLIDGRYFYEKEHEKDPGGESEDTARDLEKYK